MTPAGLWCSLKNTILPKGIAADRDAGIALMNMKECRNRNVLSCCKKENIHPNRIKPDTMGLLRILLAISVVLFHASLNGAQFVGGGMAVEAFFIISGFYMSLVLDKKYTGINGRYSLFISNRFLKIFPSYWAVLILSVLMQALVSLFTGHAFLVFYQASHYFMKLPGLCWLAFTNIFIIGQDVLGFMGFNRFTGDVFFTGDYLKNYPFLFSFVFIPQGWTLSLELMFYLVAPLLLRRKLAFILALMALLIFGRVILLTKLHLRYDPWIFRFFPAQLLMFLAGNVSYRLYQALLKRNAQSRLLSVCMMAFIAAFTMCYNGLPEWAYKKECYYLAIIIAIPFLINVQGLMKYDTALGELSYPVYLCHMLVLNMIVVFNQYFSLLRKIPVNLLTIILSLVLAIMLDRFIARPLERYRQARVKKPRMAAG